MSYSRRIVHYSPGPTDLQAVISDRAIAGCWFELHRQGGCGAGELRLRDEFPNRSQIDVGDWIALEFESGNRWYLGRVKNRRADSPAGVTLRLEGMAAELAEAFPGGFGRNIADGVPPHRYAQTDLFPDDPDYADETVDAVSEPHEVIELLMQQYVVPATNVTFDPTRIESPLQPAELTSLKVRGEVSVRDVIKDLSVRARDASWGVDEDGKFFFLRQRSTLLATYREGVNLVSLDETRDRDLLFNRVVLTGGLVYDPALGSDVVGRTFYRWRGNYIQPASRSQYGERRIRMWVPWIRTRSDAREFVREFFRIYAEPTTRYLVEVGNQSTLPRPWEGRIRIEARDGSELTTAQVETVRVQFDHAPRLRMQIGPVDPRTVWPEPPHHEESVIPHGPTPERGGGDIISFSSESQISSSSGGAPSVFGSLLLWLEADAIAGLNDGDPVALWEDLSGNDNDAQQATASKKPIYKTNMLNGKPAVQSNGTSHEMAIPNMDNVTNITFFAVMNRSTSGHDSLIVSTNDGGWIQSWQSASGDKPTFGKVGSGVDSATSTISTSDGWVLMSIVVGATNVDFYKNGTVIGSPSRSWSSYGSSGGTYGLFNRIGQSERWGGDLAALIVYDGAFSNASRADVEEYLSGKYGIALS